MAARTCKNVPAVEQHCTISHTLADMFNRENMKLQTSFSQFKSANKRKRTKSKITETKPASGV